jgi:hypothetical protein
VHRPFIQSLNSLQISINNSSSNSASQ